MENLKLVEFHAEINEQISRLLPSQKFDVSVKFDGKKVSYRYSLFNDYYGREDDAELTEEDKIKEYLKHSTVSTLEDPKLLVAMLKTVIDHILSKK